MSTIITIPILIPRPNWKVQRKLGSSPPANYQPPNIPFSFSLSLSFSLWFSEKVLGFLTARIKRRKFVPCRVYLVGRSASVKRQTGVASRENFAFIFFVVIERMKNRHSTLTVSWTITWNRGVRTRVHINSRRSSQSVVARSVLGSLSKSLDSG